MAPPSEPFDQLERVLVGRRLPLGLRPGDLELLEAGVELEPRLGDLGAVDHGEQVARLDVLADPRLTVRTIPAARGVM